MKIKNKGKVHPTPSSSSNDREVVLSVLKLLPAAILALASVLTLEDREVLAYMITRSLKTPSFSSSSSSSSSSESKKKSSKKAQNLSNNGRGHKPPMFDCDCFDCYTSYWVGWDSSPNRELIHQVIEAFEDHLTNGEKSSSKKINGKGKRRDKLGRAAREAQNLVVPPAQPYPPPPETSSIAADVAAAVRDTTSCDENAVVSASQAEKSTVKGNERKENGVVEEEEISEVADDDAAMVLRKMAASDHKGLARKVLPDVLGLLNSRLWSLWSPNA